MKPESWTAKRSSYVFYANQIKQLLLPKECYSIVNSTNWHEAVFQYSPNAKHFLTGSDFMALATVLLISPHLRRMLQSTWFCLKGHSINLVWHFYRGKLYDSVAVDSWQWLGKGEKGATVWILLSSTFPFLFNVRFNVAVILSLNYIMCKVTKALYNFTS